MSNKTRNIEAIRIHRPVTLGQVKDDIEAAVTAIVEILFGEPMLPPYPQSKMWRGKAV